VNQDTSRKAVWDEIVSRWAGTQELLADNMGIEYTEVSAERVVGTMPVAGNRQPYGLLHGGASAVLAETLGSVAAVLNAPDGHLAVGVELNCTHHRSATEGTVTGVATPLHTGRTMSSFEIVITDGAGKRVCTSRLTCAVRPADATPKAAG
jgi:uncharacterized protein (TIGR00369 family)